MKKQTLLISILIFVQFLFAGPAISTSADLPSDLNVLVDSFHRDFHDDHDFAEALKANLTQAGSSLSYVGINDNYAIGASVNVLLMPATDVKFTDAELSTLTTWFNSDGKKLLWIAGDSDFSGFFNLSNINAVFESIGSVLRIGAESIEDPISNDDAAYRVMPNSPVTGGIVNSQVNVGVSTYVLHGPAPIVAMKGGEVVNPSETSLDGVEIIMETSGDAVAIDSDNSGTEFDYYTRHSVDAPYPIVAIEDLGDSKWVIATGEAQFSDYWDMYGKTTRRGSNTDGKTFVDNVLQWFSTKGDTDTIRTPPVISNSNITTEVNEPEESVSEGPSIIPFPTVTAFFSFVMIALLAKRRNYLN